MEIGSKFYVCNDDERLFHVIARHENMIGFKWYSQEKRRWRYDWISVKAIEIYKENGSFKIIK